MQSPPLTPSTKAAAGVIRQLEASFDVNALTFRGVQVWPWLRNGLLFYYSQGRGPLLEPPLQATQSAPQSTTDADARFELSLQPRLKHTRRPRGAAALAAIEPADVLFIARGDRRGVMIDNKAFQTEIDPLIYRLENRATWLKLDMSEPPEATSSFYPAVYADPSPYLRWMTSLDRAQAAVFDRPLDEIEQWQTLRPWLPPLTADYRPLPHDPAELAEKAALILYAARWFTQVLERARPRLVVSVGHSMISHGIFLACHRAGIRCVDVQHGMGASRVGNMKWYGWQTVPDEGYEILPDYFWVWSAEAQERIHRNTNNAHVHQAIIGGEAWLSVCAELLGAAPRERSDSSLKVLVTLTPFSAAPPPDYLLEAITRAPKSWTWQLRMHPDDARNPVTIAALEALLADAGIENAEFSHASRAPLPVLLADSDRHVTLNSSSALQATAFGLRTVFVHASAADFFADLKNRQGFVFALDAEAILAALQGPQDPPVALISTGKELARAAFDALLGAS